MPDEKTASSDEQKIQKEQKTAKTRNGQDGGDDGLMKPRFKLATKIVNYAFFTILLVGAAVIVTVALSEPQKTDETVLLVFNAIVPVVATWVGAIITFYFSADNFEVATTQTLRAFGRDGAHLKSIPVIRAMIPFARMQTLTLLPPGQTGGATIADALAIIDNGFTRIPVINADKSLNCIIHSSQIYRYLATQVPPPAGAGGNGGPAAGSETATPANSARELLGGEPILSIAGDDTIKENIQKVAFVAKDSDLAAAKSAMERIDGCQDAIVTASGNRAEPVIGWITNVEIERFSKVKHSEESNR